MRYLSGRRAAAPLLTERIDAVAAPPVDPHRGAPAKMFCDSKAVNYCIDRKNCCPATRR
jgi:hypothetical protein